MNFNQLRYIIAVDRFRNFAKAADACDVVQSTLSKEIQRLEKEFDVMIFDRSRHPVVPTQKGEDLIARAAEILKAYDDFKQVALKKNNEASGFFNLGILPGLAPYLLPLFIERISKKYPGLHLDVSEASPQQMEEWLQAGRLDGSIVIAPFFKEGYYETKLFEEEFVLYLGQEHPLAGKKGVAFHDIPFDELILHEDIRKELLSERVVLENKQLNKQVKNVTYRSGSLETIRKIIDVNGGATLLPELATLYMGDRRKKMVVPIQEPTLSRTISLVLPRGFQKQRIVKSLIREIKQGLPAAIKKYR